MARPFFGAAPRVFPRITGRLPILPHPVSHDPGGSRLVDRPDMIQAHGLTKRYGRVTAVDALSFAIPRGRVVGFLGPNGAGKTTTIRMLAGILPPTAGWAEVEDRKSTRLNSSHSQTSHAVFCLKR